MDASNIEYSDAVLDRIPKPPDPGTLTEHERALLTLLRRDIERGERNEGETPCRQ